MRFTVKKVCTRCGKVVYLTQDKGTLQPDMLVHAEAHLEIQIDACSTCGETEQRVFIDITENRETR